MARSKKLEKNLSKVQDMLDGNYNNKIQVGVGDQEVEPTRKVGDVWTDSDGYEWEQKDGFRVKKSNTPAVGLGDNCSSCEKLIIKKWDKDTYKADKRCYHCQLNYELDLKFDKPIRWFAYRRLKDFQNMKSIEKDMEQWVEHVNKRNNEKIFDKSVANALANANVDTSMKVNKKLTQ